MKNAASESIRFIKPVIPPVEEWAPYLAESYAVGYFTNTGPAVRVFEQRLRDRYARGRAAVTGPNATNSLVAALQTLGVRGKVLTPSYTFPATAHAILMAGAEPVFCEIDPVTWEMDPRAAARHLAEDGITAILHMRTYGFDHDASPLEALARGRGIPLIIDSASALGGASSINGRIGQQGDIEVFSLHATKVFSIGEGSVSLMRPELEEKFRRVSNFGISYPDIRDSGLNSKMSDFQAAVGLAVLERMQGYIARRHAVAAFYHRELSGAASIRQAHHPDLAPWQYYPVLLDEGMDVGRVIERAQALGLELKRGYYRPLHQSTRFRTDIRLPVTEDVAAHVVCLPVYSDMAEETAAEVLRRFRAARD